MLENVRTPQGAWTVVHIALIALLAWMTSGVISGFLPTSFGPVAADYSAKASSSSSQYSFQSDDYSEIIRMNIFNSASVGKLQPVPRRPANVENLSDDALRDAPATSLDLKLLGTLLLGEKRLAVIQASKGSQGVFKLDEMVNGAQIVSIERSRVGLNNNGRLEVLELDYSKKEQNTSSRARLGSIRKKSLATPRFNDVSKTGDGANISKRYLEAQLKNMNSLLTQVRAVPNNDANGNMNGFKLYAIQNGSIFEKIGLSNHDVIQRINGVELDSAEKGLELFQALRNESNFNVDILRNSQKNTLRFNIQ